MMHAKVVTDAYRFNEVLCQFLGVMKTLCRRMSEKHDNIECYNFTFRLQILYQL